MTTTLRRLELPDEIQQRIAAVEAAYDNYLPGGESASVVELPKLLLADAVLRAVGVDMHPWRWTEGRGR
jgi:hypothetical protein